MPQELPDWRSHVQTAVYGTPPPISASNLPHVTYLDHIRGEHCPDVSVDHIRGKRLLGDGGLAVARCKQLHRLRRVRGPSASHAVTWAVAMFFSHSTVSTPPAFGDVSVALLD